MEIWKQVEEFSGDYQVSNYGNVRSVDRMKYCGNNSYQLKKGVDKKIQTQLSGHLYVNLWRNNKNHTRRIHRLVAISFIPNPSDYPIVMHLDDDPTNNYIDNLQWGTLKMNTKDMISKNRNKNQY
jgi:hypothetical protein